MIRWYLLQQCNLARVINGMLRYTQEQAVEIAGPARNSDLQPIVGEGFDRFNQSQMIREKCVYRVFPGALAGVGYCRPIQCDRHTRPSRNRNSLDCAESEIDPRIYVAKQFPNRMSTRNGTGLRLFCGHVIKHFFKRISIPRISIDRRSQLVGDAIAFSVHVRPLPCSYYTEAFRSADNRASRIISCRSHSLRRRDLVQQKFTSGALIEKRAYSRVVEARDSQPRGRCAPIPYYLCQVLQGKQGSPPSSGLRLAQIILSANASHAVQGRKEEASAANCTEVREIIVSDPIRESSRLDAILTQLACPQVDFEETKANGLRTSGVRHVQPSG